MFGGELGELKSFFSGPFIRQGSFLHYLTFGKTPTFLTLGNLGKKIRSPYRTIPGSSAGSHLLAVPRASQMGVYPGGAFQEEEEDADVKRMKVQGIGNRCSCQCVR